MPFVSVSAKESTVWPWPTRALANTAFRLNAPALFCACACSGAGSGSKGAIADHGVVCQVPPDAAKHHVGGLEHGTAEVMALRSRRLLHAFDEMSWHGC